MKHVFPRFTKPTSPAGRREPLVATDPPACDPFQLLDAGNISCVPLREDELPPRTGPRD